MLLRLHTNLPEPLPGIIENYRGVGTPALAQWLGSLDNGNPHHHFTVLLPTHTIDTQEKRAVVERMIDANKPAHTCFFVRPVTPGTRLKASDHCGSALGLDSFLSGQTTWRLDTGEVLPDAVSEGALGATTMLTETVMPRAVAVRLGETRLGVARLGCHISAPCEDQ